MLSNMDKKNGAVMFACKMSVLSPLLTVRNMAFQEMVEALRGEAFCQNPALDLAEEQVQ